MRSFMGKWGESPDEERISKGDKDKPFFPFSCKEVYSGTISCKNYDKYVSHSRKMEKNKKKAIEEL